MDKYIDLGYALYLRPRAGIELKICALIDGFHDVSITRDITNSDGESSSEEIEITRVQAIKLRDYLNYWIEKT